MPFELTLRAATPLTPLPTIEEVLPEFLRQIGYLPEGPDGRSGDGPVRETIAYRLVRECLLKDPNKPWYPEELVAVLGAAKASVYRHLNKLKSLDLLEEVDGVADGKGRKGYRLRYGNLARAWDFTEANAQNALKRYRETVDHLQTLIDAAIRSAGTAAAPVKSPSREKR
ncbi:MAG TPA: transcriptional regulator [Thermoplasmata archaeon]|nr:transcriptional regulator [Thermoplasmata archaeon]